MTPTLQITPEEMGTDKRLRKILIPAALFCFSFALLGVVVLILGIFGLLPNAEYIMGSYFCILISVIITIFISVALSPKIYWSDTNKFVITDSHLGLYKRRVLHRTWFLYLDIDLKSSKNIRLEAKKFITVVKGIPIPDTKVVLSWYEQNKPRLFNVNEYGPYYKSTQILNTLKDLLNQSHTTQVQIVE